MKGNKTNKKPKWLPNIKNKFSSKNKNLLPRNVLNTHTPTNTQRLKHYLNWEKGLGNTENLTRSEIALGEEHQNDNYLLSNLFFHESRM